MNNIYNFTIFNERFYTEYKSYFTHNNQLYNLNKLIRLSNDNTIYKVNVNKLKWILKYSNIYRKRVLSANINFPILVTKIGKKYYILDGAHRLKKALNNDIKYIKVKFISKEILDMCKINKN